MTHLRHLVLFLWLFPGGARRTIRVERREAFIPGGFGTGIFLRAGPHAGALPNVLKQPGQSALHHEIHRHAPAFRFGPPRAKVALLAADPKEDPEEQAPDPKEVVSTAEDQLKKSVASVQEQLANIRVGKASPNMLDRVMVNYYDAETPLNQLAMVTVPSAQQLVVDPFDKGCIKDIEKALLSSDLGLTPNNDGKIIRLNIPQLTGERRKELSKLAKSRGEEGKTSIRNVRKTAMDKLKKMRKQLGEDNVRDFEDEVQKLVKKYEADIEKFVGDREKDILSV